MVCTRNDLSEWKDFPKGLKVLLLDEDSNSASEIKSKLESMDYIVYTFCNEKEAVSAISSGLENFHVAIVEVTNELLSLTAMLESVDEFLEACVIKPSAMIVSTNGNDGGFKFLEAAKDLPTIMTSNIHCISTMMKCIALGAVEFLRKPLSEDKLRNIWQHVVHKAFSAGENDLSESLKPVKHSVASMLSEDEKHKHDDSDKIEDESVIHENDHEPSAASNKYPAPSTPQLEQGGRVLVNGDCHTNCSAEKESGELDGEYKSVETTSGNVIAEGTAPVGEHQGPMETIEKQEEADLVDGPKGENMIDSHPQDRVDGKDSDAGAEKPNTVSGLPSSYPNKANRKKMKVDWTTELHKKFVQAVDQLGIDQAIPSRILELMKVEGLTRHNVASHLQKYRMHRRHILPKEAHDRKWPRIDQAQRSFYPHKPIMAFPPYHSNHVVPVGRVYPMWGAPHAASIQTWGSQGYYPWQPTEPWHWKPYPGMHADAWGCPVMPVPQGNCSPFPQVNGFHCSGTMDNKSGMPQNCVEHQPAEDVIDEVVKEAINKPWLPLPLGLKPPSTDSVLAELSRQGISTIPPHNQRL